MIERDNQGQKINLFVVYRKAPDEQSLGFIVEGVPDLVATKDRKGMR